MKPEHLMKNQERAESLRQLSRMYVQVQKWRLRFANLKRGKTPFLKDDLDEWDILFTNNENTILKIEEELMKKMGKLVKAHSWGEYLLGIRGVGPGIAGSIIGELCGDIYGSIKEGELKNEEGKLPKAKFISHGPREFEKTSDLWAFAGYHVKDGKAVKPKRGEKANWNKYLKIACFKFAENQIKQGEEYRKIYDLRKAYEMERDSKMSKGHADRRAKRYIIKKFLSNIKHDLVMGGLC